MMFTSKQIADLAGKPHKHINTLLYRGSYGINAKKFGTNYCINEETAKKIVKLYSEEGYQKLLDILDNQ